jgi:hypothetical protein
MGRRQRAHLCEDEGALVRIWPSGLVRVFQLRDAFRVESEGWW